MKLNLEESDLDFIKPAFDLESGLAPVSNEDRAHAEFNKLMQLAALMEKYEEVSKAAGIDKWFVLGTPYGIENCPKHRAFFDAGALYNERLFLAANRIGKSISGAFESACHATG